MKKGKLVGNGLFSGDSVLPFRDYEQGVMKKLYQKYKEIINYLIVGVLTTVVSLGVYYGATALFLDAKNPVQLQIANVLSWICAVAFAYFTNRKYVFESKNPNIVSEASKFVGSRVTTLLMDMGVMALTVSVFHMNDRIAKLLSQVVVTIGNYVISKFLVFRKK